MDRTLLEGKDRDELVAMAEKLGVERPRVLTRDELEDEILRRSVAPGPERARARGWLGRARDLLASVVEHSLHLPEAARALRTQVSEPPPPPPIATVTLAEIYAAQGHVGRAVGILDEVLAREPGHAEAERIRAQLLATGRRAQEEKRTEQPADGALEERVVPGEQSSPPATLDAPAERTATGAAAPAPHHAEDLANAEVEPGIDVDDVVALAVAPGELYVYWEVRRSAVERVRAAAPDGALVLRVLAVTPSWEGPDTSFHDVSLPSESGDTLVRDVPPGAVVRVSVGWKTPGRPAPSDFEPLAVGAEVASPKGVPAASTSTVVRRWTGPRRPPADVETPLRPIVAAALLRARGLVVTPPALLGDARAARPGAAMLATPSGGIVLEERIIGGAVGALPPAQSVSERGGVRVVTFERGGASDLIRREQLVPHGAAAFHAPFGGASDLS